MGNAPAMLKQAQPHFKRAQANNQNGVAHYLRQLYWLEAGEKSVKRQASSGLKASSNLDEAKHERNQGLCTRLESGEKP